MKIISFNVNGIRSAIKKGFIDYALAEMPDVMCLQEIRALREDANLRPLEEAGYTAHWHPAIKKGYSGVATLVRQEPECVQMGCGLERYDSEGRVLTLQINGVAVTNVYMPSGTTGEVRQQFKYEWLDDFLPIALGYRDRFTDLVVCGDYNICHRDIDIHNPKGNQKTSGFLPGERAWLDKYEASGFTDAYRHLNPDGVAYSWWSNRPGVRERNLGWRIDHHWVSAGLVPRLQKAYYQPEVKLSDHCPAVIETQ